MGRALLTTLATLAVLATAALLVWQTQGGPEVPSLAALEALDPAALGTALRLAVWVMLGLLLVLLILRVTVALALLFRLHYAPLAYLGQALLLPVVRRTAGGITAGVMVGAQLVSGGQAGAAERAGGAAPVSVAVAALPHGGPPAEPAAAPPAPLAAGRGSPTAGVRSPARPARLLGRRGGRRARRRSGPGAALREGAITYTVQPGDSLSLIARRFYGDLLAYPRLFRANRGRPQPDGGRLASPWILQPGWRLLVPLPSPVLTINGDQLRYVVQGGDSLSGIAAALLGDWRRYTEILDLNRDRGEPDGSALRNPDLIQPGWTLVLPADGLRPPLRRVVTTTGRPLSTRAARVLRRAPHGRAARSPYPGTDPSHQPSTGRSPVPRAQPHQPFSATGPPRRPAIPTTLTTGALPVPTHAPVPARGRHTDQPPAAPPAPQSIGAVHHAQPTPLASSAAPPPDRQGRGGAGHTAYVGPREAPAPAAHPRPRAGAGAGTAPPDPGPTGRGHVAGRAAGRPARTTPRTHPTVLLPDGGTIPASLAALFLSLLAAVAWRRQRRGQTGAARPIILTTAPIRSLANTWLRPGTKGWLVAALSGRMRGDEADRIAPLLARLEGALGERGLGRPPVRWVREGDSSLTIALATTPAGSRILEAARLDLERHLGCPVASVRPDRGGVLLELRSVPGALRSAASSSGAAPDGVPPAAGEGEEHTLHPAPLLVPLGARAEDDQVVHVNLAQLGTLLIASGPTAGAQPLLITLLTHLVAQCSPADLQLLLAAEREASLSPLEQLPHLLAPPGASWEEALAALLDAAEAVLLERVAAMQDDAPGAPQAGQRHAYPALVIAIDGLERLLGDPLQVSRLDALCRHGAAHGLCVVAATDDIAAVDAADGLLDAFRGRVAFRLADEGQSRQMLGQGGAESLSQGALLWAAGESAPERLRSLALSASNAREVLAAVIARYAPDPPLHLVSPGDGEPHAEDAPRCSTTPPADGPTPPGNAAVAGEGEALCTPAGEPPARLSVAQPGGPAEVGTRAVPAGSGQAEHGPTDQDPPARDEQEGGPAANVAAPQENTPFARASGAPEARPTGARRRAAPMPPVQHEPMDTSPAHAAPAAARIILRLLGGLRVEVAGQALEVAALPRRQQEMLAYLALAPGQAASRDRLAEAFWPEEDPAVSSNRFHRTLRKLREGLAGPLGVPLEGAVVTQLNSTYLLYPGLVWADAVAFEDALADAAAAVGAARAEALRQALSLYGGDLFGDRVPLWAEEESRRLRERSLQAAHELAVWYEEQGELARALAMALCLAEAESTREAYHRRVMRLQARRGDLEAVRRQYAHLCGVLRAEVDAEPDERTRRLYRRLVTPEQESEGGDGTHGGQASALHLRGGE